MTTSAVTIPLWADLSAVAVGALQGAMFAWQWRERRIDLLGVVIVGTWTGLGGSLIRDVMLAQIPATLKSNWYLITAFAAALLGMLLQRLLGRLDRVIIALDALALGLYAAVGASKALQYGVPAVPAMFIGVAAAVGGSALRDVFLGLPIALAQIGSLYAGAAIVGVAALVIASGCGLAMATSALLCVVVTTTVRLCAVAFRWQLPEQWSLRGRRGERR